MRIESLPVNDSSTHMAITGRPPQQHSRGWQQQHISFATPHVGWWQEWQGTRAKKAYIHNWANRAFFPAVNRVLWSLHIHVSVLYDKCNWVCWRWFRWKYDISPLTDFKATPLALMRIIEWSFIKWQKNFFALQVWKLNLPWVFATNALQNTTYGPMYQVKILKRKK